MAPVQILVVEDEAIIAEDLQDTLKDLGYAVSGAVSSAEQAIQKVAQNHPDLVLMDIRLQGITDGIDAAQQIRAHFRTPVIYLTAHTDAATLDRAKTTEPLGYLLKPFSARELHATVEMALYKHRMEQKLRESEQHLATTLLSIGDAVITTDRRGTVDFLNPAAEALTGWGRQEACGRDLPEVFHIISEETRHTAENPAAKALQEGQVTGLPKRTLLIARDGAEIPIDDNAAPIHDDQGNVVGAVLVFRDMTESRRLEERLRAAQKVEAIGKLAGGIAHDFNNLMTVVLSSSWQLLNDPPQPAKARELLENIKNAGELAAALTRQLLAFSRKQLLVPVVLDLNRLITDMAGMLRPTIGEHIDLVVVPNPALPFVKADHGQLQQVVLNLVINARDAMPRGGQLILETAPIELDATYARAHPEVQQGRYARLAVHDTGCGMDERTRARLFDPFFTTKEFGKGTGLGLATAYGIVKQSGGHIEVASVPGKGSTFTLYFPEAAPEGRPPEPPADRAELPHSTETVLLVEDDNAVREVSAQFLEKQGFTVHRAHHGGEALALFEYLAPRIHLLVTDVIMPQMSGVELAERLTARRPDLKVLYLSGYTGGMLADQGVLEAGTAFLQKPYTPNALVRKMREVLDTKQQA